MVFFPAEDRAVAVMSTFGVFALSFLVRPIGAIFWGNMGDKKGRKWALSVSILLMSGATFLIGCLPGYAVIGVGPPLLLLLLRMVQSFSAAGEYAGAATFIAGTRRITIAGSTARWCRPPSNRPARGLASGHVHVYGLGRRFVLRRRLGLAHPVLAGASLGLHHPLHPYPSGGFPVYAQMQERMKEWARRVGASHSRCSPSISGCCSSRSVPAC